MFGSKRVYSLYAAGPSILLFIFYIFIAAMHAFLQAVVSPFSIFFTYLVHLLIRVHIYMYRIVSNRGLPRIEAGLV